MYEVSIFGHKRAHACARIYKNFKTIFITSEVYLLVLIVQWNSIRNQFHDNYVGSYWPQVCEVFVLGLLKMICPRKGGQLVPVCSAETLSFHRANKRAFHGIFKHCTFISCISYNHIGRHRSISNFRIISTLNKCSHNCHEKWNKHIAEVHRTEHTDRVVKNVVFLMDILFKVVLWDLDVKAMCHW